MKKKPRRKRPEHPAGTRVEVEMLSIPDEGQITVRFLSEARSILTHRVGEDTLACPGEKYCPSATHRAKTLWKAYAAVERWRDVPFEDWIPEVLEITERLWERLAGRVLRGEVWTLKREVGRSGHKECVGEHVDTINEEHLRSDVVLETTVCRVYRTDNILWDVDPFLPVRQILAPSHGERPRHLAPPAAKEKGISGAEYKALKERLAAEGKGTLVNATGNGSSNGKH